MMNGRTDAGRTGWFVMRVFCLFVCSFFMREPISHAADFDYGAALRQNVLVMRNPDDPISPVTTSVFGMSESRTRLWSQVGFRYGVVHAAIDSRASFNSLNSAGGAISGGGSLFGQSVPLSIWDMTIDHHTGRNAALLTRVDRLDVSMTLSSYTIDLGRQPITLGTSHFVGVLDVIAPFAPGELDATYKPGVDAIRIRRGIGMTAEAELIAVGDDDTDNSAYLGRARFPFGSVDIEIIAGRFRERGFGGVGWEGGVGDFGVWGEMALFERQQTDPVYAGWSEAAYSAVVGADYYWGGDTIFGGGLMYQDFGAREPEDLMRTYSSTPFTEGWVFLGAAGYAVLTAHHQVHPLVSIDASGLVSLIDGSTLWQPVILYSTGDNSDISVYGWIGSGPGMKQSGPLLTARSEFGMLPGGAGMFARWFF